MPATPTALLLLLAFLIGSIPFGYLLYRVATGQDIRRAGSGNIGATNVMRSAGAKLGVLTLLLDAGKGYVALWLGERWAHGHAAVLAAMLFLVILGHLYSPWLRFRGGKGVATALGSFLALTPGPLLGALAVFVLVLLAWRYVSLASIAACAALPLLLLIPLRQGGLAPVTEAAAVAVAALIVVRHRTNLGRLRRGTEAKLGARP
ncbi:MAG: glycerol-3-phosphate 1-O-acyltransferase PlsY [Terriglobales bacterium]